MKKEKEFELLFKDFVKKFGGEVLPETEAKTADYLFSKQNVVAELKCLVEDSTENMNKKLTSIVEAWAKHDNRESWPPTEENGRSVFSIKNAPTKIQHEWIEILKKPLAGLIGDANAQIRSTKEQTNLPTAKGLVLIFNVSNYLHTRPQDYKKLLVEVLRKRTQDGQRRFPHVHASVYFSFETVNSEKERMSFWAPIRMQTSPNDSEEEMAQFLQELRQAWYDYVGKTFGRIVREHVIE